MTDSVPAVAPAIVGVEHELAIVGPEGWADARAFADQLGALGPRLRASRPSTVRLRCGAEVSWEEGDLELASPPIPLASGVTDELVAWMGTAVGAALEALPSEVRLEGRSTHLSISVTEDWMTATCALLAYRFVPALMLLTEGQESEGILIRPRLRTDRGRDRLRARRRFARRGGACDRRCARLRGRREGRDGCGVTAGVGRSSRRRRDTTVRLVRGSRRGGADLCAGGRATPLIRDGHPTTAGAHLEDAWASARRALAPFVSAARPSRDR